MRPGKFPLSIKSPSLDKRNPAVLKTPHLLKRCPALGVLPKGRYNKPNSRNRMKTTTSHPYRVLIADDQADIRDALRLLLKREGYETQGASSPAEALAAIEAREFDAVLMDLNYTRDTTSGQEGLDLLPRVLMIDGAVNHQHP